VGSLNATELNKSDLKNDIAKGKLSAGWKSMNKTLNDANKNENDPAIRRKNKQIIGEFIGIDHYPKSSLLHNYDSAQKNKLNGKDEVLARPSDGTLPRITKKIIKAKGKYRGKVAEINFDASYGEVEYRINFKQKHLFKRTNAFYLEIKSSVEKIKFLLDCGDNVYDFYYGHLEPTWGFVILPFEVFEGYTPDQAKKIQALRLIINGEELQEESLQGSFYLDNLKLLKYKEKDLEAQIQETRRYRYEVPLDMIEEIYKEREPF